MRRKNKPTAGTELPTEAAGSAGPGNDDGASTGVFLGTLRSEFDEPDALPVQFAELKAQMERVLGSYQSHETTRRELAEGLAALRCRDVSGSEWTMGARTGSWYRRAVRGGTWHPSPPPNDDQAGSAVVAPWERIEPQAVPELPELHVAELPLPELPLPELPLPELPELPVPELPSPGLPLTAAEGDGEAETQAPALGTWSPLPAVAERADAQAGTGPSPEAEPGLASEIDPGEERLVEEQEPPLEEEFVMPPPAWSDDEDAGADDEDEFVLPPEAMLAPGQPAAIEAPVSPELSEPVGDDEGYGYGD